jgi:hypothetical protein
MMSAVIGSLADRTGRTLEEWLALVDASGIDPLDQNDPPASGRLQQSNGPGQATHKIALRSVADVDDEVLHLVRLAYDQNG